MFDFMLTDEQQALRDEVRAFVREKVPRRLILDMDADRVRYPRGYVQDLAAQRLLGLRFAPEYGGRGLGWQDEIVALEEIGVLGTSLACLFSLPSIVGEALHVFGTPEQKARWLRPTLAGELTVAEALTEPRGGSDFFGTTTTAVRDGAGFRLKGQKRFVVGAEGADLFLVYARTDPDAPPHEGISAFVVERGEGVEVHHVYFYQMMIPERMTSAAGALGMARAALEIAARYADQRKAFGQKIRRFEGVSFKIAEGLTRLDAARGLIYATARAIDGRVASPGRVRRMVSESKKFATETAWQVVNEAMQILGGIGYTDVYPIERLLRDVRLITIWTGTNEIMNLVIQHEFYREFLATRSDARDVEADAAEGDNVAEKVYE